MRWSLLPLLGAGCCVLSCGALSMAPTNNNEGAQPDAAASSGADENNTATQAAAMTAQAATSGNSQVAAASAANTTTRPASLEFAATGFTAAEGKAVHAVAYDSAGAKAGTAAATVKGGNFNVSLGSFTDKLVGGRIAFYVDADNNEICNIAGTDVGGNVTITADAGGVQGKYDAKAAVPCEAFGDFALQVKGVNFTPHNTQMLYLAVRDTKDNSFVAGPSSQVVANGAWSMSFPGVLVTGHTYEIRYFADIAKTGKCQDHSWVTPVPKVAADATLTVQHTQKQVAICTAFPPLP